ncbi:hypothetical protein H6P81_020020 [Aristolochia fimbriata]|uniref:Carbamoyl phosphate synthase ATP-binding domain-containing protein n=1 Tax=Aristolochia fimbriata TaxID=158543 RepID=A0AAV7DV58_ARIFI|nr:hypothetical protein H6P81_020020 [Aristolochia fimbriata]
MVGDVVEIFEEAWASRGVGILVAVIEFGARPLVRGSRRGFQEHPSVDGSHISDVIVEYVKRKTKKHSMMFICEEAPMAPTVEGRDGGDNGGSLSSTRVGYDLQGELDRSGLQRLPDNIRVRGDKATARETMKKVIVPTVHGSDGLLQSTEEVVKLAREIGFPVMIKDLNNFESDPEEFAQSLCWDLGIT